MRLGTKHQNQFQIVFADFSGGLNTSESMDGIAENQLAIAANVEVDQTSGKLKTVAGTRILRKVEALWAAMYDDINKVLLLVKEDKKVYALDLVNDILSDELGALSGDLYPITTSWEDGLLIASGGKLQYYNGETLKTITTSPMATSVYVRAGRVLVTDEANVRYSGVGDEENWEEDTNDDSSSKFVEAGYKDGGKLLAMVNLSSDVLMIKNNRRVYRLSGEFPNWSMSEVSRNVEVSGRLSICAVSDSVFILGRNGVQNIVTTNAYGDMKPQMVSTLITREIQNLPETTMLRYIPSLNQIWAISGDIALVFDLVVQGWYKRKFNSPVIDVIPVGNEVLIIKKDAVTKLDGNSFYDDDQPLFWKFQCRRLISHYDYFLKRTSVSFMPHNRFLSTGQVRVGAVIVNLPNFKTMSERRFAFSKGTPIYKNPEPIYGSPLPIYSRPTIIAESRNVFRSKFLDIMGYGITGGITLNSITLDLVEV